MYVITLWLSVGVALFCLVNSIQVDLAASWASRYSLIEHHRFIFSSAFYQALLLALPVITLSVRHRDCTSMHPGSSSVRSPRGEGDRDRRD